MVDLEMMVSSQRTMSTTTIVLGLISILLFDLAISQNPIFGGINSNNDPTSKQGSNTYYFSRASDCNKPIRNIAGELAIIEGHGLSTNQPGPKSCTIRLKSEQQFQGVILHIELRSMKINTCDTLVSIYDGDGSNLLLNSFDCKTTLPMNQRAYRTSGDTATFIMTRENVERFNYDIEIRVSPIRGGTDPGFENGYGSDFYFDKYNQKAIVGMIGGFYILILFVTIVVMLYYWYWCNGKTKEWETHQLAAIKTDDSFQNRRLMKPERENERSGPPTYASRNQSFEEPPSPEFKERIITPRVRTTKNRPGRRPPSYEEAISESASEHSSDEEVSDEESTDESIRKKSISSRSERSRSDSGSEEESEEESSEDDSRRGRGARGGRRHRKQRDDRRYKSRPNKNSSRDSRDSRDEDVRPSRRNPRQTQPHPTNGQPVPYPAYPPGQFVPVMAGHPQFQTVPLVPAYAPPRYPEEHQAAAPGPNVQPTDPPVYSYLVRRGYNPVDTHSNSQGSLSGSQRSGAGRLDEPDVRLESGVDYMRR